MHGGFMKLEKTVLLGPGGQTTSVVGQMRKIATAGFVSGLLLGIAVLFLLSAPVVEAQTCDKSCFNPLIQPSPDPNPPTGGILVDRAKPSNQTGLGTLFSAPIPIGGATSVQGSSSYTYGVPMFSKPGRAGMDMNLALYYNSHIWIPDATGGMMMGFDRNTPGPGFQLNLGFLEWNPASNFPAGILTSPDGAKHTLAIDVNNLVPNAPPPNNTSYHCANQVCLYNTDDSSYINVARPLGTVDGNVCVGPNNCPAKDVTVTYKNGTQAIYQSFAVVTNDLFDELVMRPYRITDTNGNFIIISYINTNDLSINSITDSLGRTLNFFYTSVQVQITPGQASQTVPLLSCVTDGASCDAAGAKTYSFTWDQTHSINFNFSTGGQALVGGNLYSVQSGFTLPVVTKVCRPDATCVQFNYGDWGIVNDIKELSNNGAVRYELSYDFPTAASGSLTANPTYTHQTENVNGQTNAWTYGAINDANGVMLSSSVTDPSGLLTTTSYSRNGDWQDGLPSKVQFGPFVPIFGPTPSMLVSGPSSTRTLTWVSDVTVDRPGIGPAGIPTGANPRPSSVTTTLDDNSQSQTTFQYDLNGNITDKVETDIGATAPGPTLRETVSTYATLGNHILDHPTDVKVKDGSGKVISHTTFAYDETSVQAVASAPAGHDSSVQYSASNSAGRGNLTTRTTYTDPVAGTGPIASTFSYDMLGNKVSETDGCCTQTAWIYSIGTQYAYPDSVVQGQGAGPLGSAPMGTQLTTSFTYLFSTGQVVTETDWNGKVTTFGYDPAGRLSSVTTPDGVTANTGYDDTAANPSVKQSSSANSLVTVHTMDFRGHTLSDQVLNGTTPVSTQVYINDSKGRPLQVSNPYKPGETPVYTSYIYDLQGRAIQTTPPALTSGGTQNPYTVTFTGKTSLVTDPAGHQRKQYSNGLGQLVQVDEPGPSGGQAGAGSIAISGTEGSASVPNGGGATAGIGSVTIGGSDRSTQVLAHNATPAIGTVTISGSDNSTTVDPCAGQGIDPTRGDGSGPSCPMTVWDSGTVSLTINGTTQSVGYGQSTAPSDIASGLAAAFGNTGTYTVTASGSVVTIMANTAGANGNNIALSAASSTSDATDFGGPSFAAQPSGAALAGGSDNGYTTVYDTGTITVTVNGFSKSTTYGQSTSTSATASDLANKFNSDNASPVIANASGSVINLTTKATGQGTNYPLSATAATTSQYFTAGSASFSGTPSGNTMTPGQNGIVYDAGTVTVTVNGFSNTPYAKSVNYSQGSTPSAIASGVAGALNGDNNSPVTAAISSSSSSTVLLTAKLQGANTNYGVVGSSATTQSTYFSQPSFTASGTSLTGGADQSFSLSTPITTTFSYDPLGHRLQVTRGQQTRTSVYDGLGRMTSITTPETAGQPITYTYTDFGAVATRTDPRTLPGTTTHIQTTYAYDPLGRITSITYNDNLTPNVTYGYNGPGSANNTGGRLATVSNSVESKAYQYDVMGRTSQCMETIGAKQYTVNYAYAADGQVSSITYPSLLKVNYSYDPIGRLQQLGTASQNILSINAASDYSAAGMPLLVTYGNNIKGTFGYNNQLQLSSIQYSAAAPAAPLLSLTYLFGGSSDNGEIQGITDNLNSARSTSYQYDGLGRLKMAQTVDQTSAGTWKLGYAYDIYGNRPDQIPLGGAGTMPPSNVAVDPTTNRIKGSGALYDAAGNMTSDGLNNNVFGAENQLLSTNPVPGLFVGSPSTFNYGPDGALVNRNGATFIYAGGQVVAEYPNNAAVSSPSVEYINLGGQQLATVAGGAVTYNYPDHLSTRVTANAAGVPVSTHGHFPAGETWYQTGPTSDFQFTSYRRDPNSGLDYANARFYSSRLGRFISQDPIAGGGYGYADSDPINLVDPSGMDTACTTNPFDPRPLPLCGPDQIGSAVGSGDKACGITFSDGGISFGFASGCSGFSVSFTGSNNGFGNIRSAIQDILKDFFNVDTCPAGTFECPENGAPLFEDHCDASCISTNGFFPSIPNVGVQKNVVSTLVGNCISIMGGARVIGCTFACEYIRAYPSDGELGIGLAHFSKAAIDKACGSGFFCPLGVVIETQEGVNMSPKILSCTAKPTPSQKSPRRPGSDY
jgi:RHS repeat-associated protein